MRVVHHHLAVRDHTLGHREVIAEVITGCIGQACRLDPVVRVRAASAVGHTVPLVPPAGYLRDGAEPLRALVQLQPYKAAACVRCDVDRVLAADIVRCLRVRIVHHDLAVRVHTLGDREVIAEVVAGRIGQACRLDPVVRIRAASAVGHAVPLVPPARYLRDGAQAVGTFVQIQAHRAAACVRRDVDRVLAADIVRCLRVRVVHHDLAVVIRVRINDGSRIIYFAAAQESCNCQRYDNSEDASPVHQISPPNKPTLEL